MKLNSLTEERSKELLSLNFFNSLAEASLGGFPFFKTTQNLFFFDQNNKPAAVLLYRKIDKTLTEIDYIAVRKEHRGKGLAKKLIDSLEGQIWLEVHEENKAAIKLYEATGFQKSGYRKRYYGLYGAILMEKKP